MGDTTTEARIAAVTCTGLTDRRHDHGTLTGCTVPTRRPGDKYTSTSLIGAPGAAIVPDRHPRPDRRGAGTSTARSSSRTTRTSPSCGSPTPPTASTSPTSGLANGGVISGPEHRERIELRRHQQPGDHDDEPVEPERLRRRPAPPTRPRCAGSARPARSSPTPTAATGCSSRAPGRRDGDSDAFNQIFYSTRPTARTGPCPTRWSAPTTPSPPRPPRTHALAGRGGRAARDQRLLLGPGLRPERRPEPRRHADDGLRRLPAAQADLQRPARYSAPTPRPVHRRRHRPGPLPQHPDGDALVGDLARPSPPTTSGVTASPPAPVVGQPVTLTATVTVPSPGAGTPDRHRDLQRRPAAPCAPGASTTRLRTPPTARTPTPGPPRTRSPPPTPATPTSPDRPAPARR